MPLHELDQLAKRGIFGRRHDFRSHDIGHPSSVCRDEVMGCRGLAVQQARQPALLGRRVDLGPADEIGLADDADDGAPLSSTIGAALTPEPSSSSAASNIDSLTLRRFWNNQPDEHGALIHRRNGSWAFSYASGDDNDEPIFRFDRHLFVEGEYVTVTEHDGVARPFRIVHVAPAVVHH